MTLPPQRSSMTYRAPVRHVPGVYPSRVICGGARAGVSHLEPSTIVYQPTDGSTLPTQDSPYKSITLQRRLAQHKTLISNRSSPTHVNALAREAYSYSSYTQRHDGGATSPYVPLDIRGCHSVGPKLVNSLRQERLAPSHDHHTTPVQT